MTLQQNKNKTFCSFVMQLTTIFFSNVELKKKNMLTLFNIE